MSISIECDTPLDLGSDRSLRLRHFTEESFEHPAKMHAGLLLWLVNEYTRPGQAICDPMYGIGTTGLAALLQRDVIGYEIEPPFLAEAHRNAAHIIEAGGLFAGRITIEAHDARLPWPRSADVVLFSPPYGCDVARNSTGHGMRPDLVAARLAKVSHNRAIWERALSGKAKGSHGALMMHYGDHPAQLGHLRGARYWAAMTDVYTQARASLRSNGKLILVIKDHIKKGQRICVADQTVVLCESLGFTLTARHARHVQQMSLWQRRRKERGDPVVEDESVLVFV